MGGLLITVFTTYCSPRTRTGKGRGREGTGLYPELACFGIDDGVSPNVQEEAGRAVALHPIALAREELTRRGLELDEKAVQRLARQLGLQVLATRTRDLLRFRAGQLLPGTEFAGKRIAVQIDGGRVRIRTQIKKSRVGKKRKRVKFKVEWREPKTMTLFILDKHGRMDPKTRSVIDGTLQGPDHLAELVAFHLHRTGAAAATEIVFVADGARWIWSRVAWIVKRAGLDSTRVVQVLDWCHAVHHLGLALAALRLTAPVRQERFGQWRQWLKRGSSQTLLDAMGEIPFDQVSDRKIWNRECGYFRRHHDEDRLRYAVCRYRKLPIGSGAIESVIRRTLNLRLKGNSIYWTETNAEAVFQLRAALLSGRWKEVLAHARDTMATDRRRDWHCEAPTDLKNLNAPEDDEEESPQVLRFQPSKRLAA